MNPLDKIIKDCTLDGAPDDKPHAGPSLKTPAVPIEVLAPTNLTRQTAISMDMPPWSDADYRSSFDNSKSAKRALEVCSEVTSQPEKRQYRGSELSCSTNSSSLTCTTNTSSLMDDDYDEELFNYFSKSSARLSKDFEYDPRYWIANNESVPNVPSFYPIFNSSVTITNGSARLIAERIQTVLRDRSIVAIYSSRGAKADCTTKQNVNFRIRLYRGNGKDSNAIIVDLHRQEGFDHMYHKDMYAIFDAAKGKTSDPTLNDEPPVCHNGGDMKCKEMSTRSSLEMFANLLCSENEVSKAEDFELALSALTSFTSPDKMGRLAVQIAKELMYSPDMARLRDTLISNACSSEQQPSSLAFSHRSTLRYLEILANVTSSLQCDAEPYDFSSRKPVVLHLISLVENAAVDPRAADLSCLIIKSTNECLALNEGEIARLKEALRSANEHGSKTHADLELHSRQCLDELVFFRKSVK